MEILKKVGKKSLVIGFAMILLLGCSQTTSAPNSRAINNQTGGGVDNSEILKAEREFENIIGTNKTLYYAKQYVYGDYYNDYQNIKITDPVNNKLCFNYKVIKHEGGNTHLYSVPYGNTFNDITYKGTEDGFIEFSYFGPKFGWDSSIDYNSCTNLGNEKNEQKIKLKIKEHNDRVINFIIKENNSEETSTESWTLNYVPLQGDE